MLTALLATAIATATLGQPHFDEPIVVVKPREGVLLTPRPYPANRVDSPERPGNGRLWIPRYPVGTRTPIAEGTFPGEGPASYGAAPDQVNQLILVRTRESIQDIAINPWQTVDQRTIDELTRTRPWIRRTEGIEEDLRAARRQWLKENGYVAKVRSHINPGPIVNAGAEPAPRPLVRVVPPGVEPTEVENRSDDHSEPRISTPKRMNTPRVIVIRESPQDEEIQEDDGASTSESPSKQAQSETAESSSSDS